MSKVIILNDLQIKILKAALAVVKDRDVLDMIRTTGERASVQEVDDAIRNVSGLLETGYIPDAVLDMELQKNEVRVFNNPEEATNYVGTILLTRINKENKQYQEIKENLEKLSVGIRLRVVDVG